MSMRIEANKLVPRHCAIQCIEQMNIFVIKIITVLLGSRKITKCYVKLKRRRYIMYILRTLYILVQSDKRLAQRTITAFE